MRKISENVEWWPPFGRQSGTCNNWKYLDKSVLPKSMKDHSMPSRLYSSCSRTNMWWLKNCCSFSLVKLMPGWFDRMVNSWLVITRFDKGITSSDQSVYLQSCSNPLYCRSFSVSRNFIEGFFGKWTWKFKAKSANRVRARENRRESSKGEFERRVQKESSKERSRKRSKQNEGKETRR